MLEFYFIFHVFFSGIPIAQQHLIWKNIELEDDFYLHDYG